MSDKGRERKSESDWLAEPPKPQSLKEALEWWSGVLQRLTELRALSRPDINVEGSETRRRADRASFLLFCVTENVIPWLRPLITPGEEVHLHTLHAQAVEYSMAFAGSADRPNLADDDKLDRALRPCEFLITAVEARAQHQERDENLPEEREKRGKGQGTTTNEERDDAWAEEKRRRFGIILEVLDKHTRRPRSVKELHRWLVHDTRYGKSAPQVYRDVDAMLAEDESLRDRLPPRPRAE